MRERIRRIWRRSRRRYIRSLYGGTDTTHRVALGVFLGCIVGATPTMGFQIALYLLVATLFRASKTSGLGPVMVTNPVTIVPIYFFSWKVGSFVLMRGADFDAAQADALKKLASSDDSGGWARYFDIDFWLDVGQRLWAIGTELWVGSLVVGVVVGVPAYVITYRVVSAFRRRRLAARKAKREQRKHPK